MCNQKIDATAVLNLLNRIPIVSWMPGQANESLVHAAEASERITHFGNPL